MLKRFQVEILLLIVLLGITGYIIYGLPTEVSEKKMAEIEVGSQTPEELKEIIPEELFQLVLSNEDMNILAEGKEYFLHINGIKIRGPENSTIAEGIRPDNISIVGKQIKLTYQLSKSEMASYFWRPFIRTKEVRVSVGNELGALLPQVNANARLQFFPEGSLIFIFVAISILLMTVIVLVRHTNIIRDMSKMSDTASKSYSLSRSQLAFWTFIVLISAIFVFGTTRKLIEVTNTTLLLLGISAATTAAGRIIDQTDIDNPKVMERMQDHQSRGFLMDILADKGGISIHRLQTLVFNVLVGLAYIYEVVLRLQLPEFDNGILFLLGLSSATYSGIKATENVERQTNVAS